MTIYTRIVLVWITALWVLVPGQLPAQDVFGETARAETENPDDMVVGNQDPGDMLAGTETPGSLSARTLPLPPRRHLPRWTSPVAAETPV